eukprot:SAG31_NODE_1160_length_9602_cov_20.626434_11_plen_173_part_00
MYTVRVLILNLILNYYLLQNGIPAARLRDRVGPTLPQSDPPLRAGDTLRINEYERRPVRAGSSWSPEQIGMSALSFCGHCGTKQDSSDSAFCAKCGTPFKALPAGDEPRNPLTTDRFRQQLNQPLIPTPTLQQGPFAVSNANIAAAAHAKGRVCCSRPPKKLICCLFCVRRP